MEYYKSRSNEIYANYDQHWYKKENLDKEQMWITSELERLSKEDEWDKLDTVTLLRNYYKKRIALTRKIYMQMAYSNIRTPEDLAYIFRELNEIK